MKLNSQISKARTNKGRDIIEISNKSPLMLVFLRHFGCVFCREALHDISEKLTYFRRLGFDVVFVHMSNKETAEKYFEQYEISDPEHISDPQCDLYSDFHLAKGTFNQLFGLKNWIRGFQTTTKGIPMTLTQVGDGFQMPGIFLIHKGEIKDQYIHKMASDRPDYEKLLDCCS